MKVWILLGILSLSGLFFGCSGAQVKRNSYEIFRIIQRDQCLRDSDLHPEECYQIENYAEYQRLRKERLNPEQDPEPL